MICFVSYSISIKTGKRIFYRSSNERTWIQPASATLEAATSRKVLYPRHFLGWLLVMCSISFSLIYIYVISSFCSLRCFFPFASTIPCTGSFSPERDTHQRRFTPSAIEQTTSTDWFTHALGTISDIAYCAKAFVCHYPRMNKNRGTGY